MRYFVFFLGAFGLLVFPGCDNIFKNKKMNTDTMNNSATPGGNNGEAMPDIKFEEEDHDIGTIEEGEIIDFSFKFTNTGKSDLLINNCTASCGCTIPHWPKEPVRPGETGMIDVQFDSNHKKNEVVKEVTVSTNCVPANRKVKFHGFVKEKPKK